MAADPISVNLDRDQEAAVLKYAFLAHSMLLNTFSMRSNIEEIDRYYMREQNYTETQIKARLANRAGNTHKMQDVTVPLIMAQVQSAMGYMTQTFLTGYPIFGVSSDPSQMDAALQMETIIAENAITAGWARELMMFFRDGLKYNLHGVELDWQQRNVANIETDISEKNAAKVKNTLWQGNVLKRMDLYNTFFDPRVHPSEIHINGEYAGYVEVMSRMRLKKYINDMFSSISAKTAGRAFESSPAGGMTSGMSPFSYYMPLINPMPIMDRQNMQSFDWMAWAQPAMAQAGLRYSNVYEVMTLYARIIPSDFGLVVAAKNTPQVWKIKIINGQVVLLMERCTNAHNFIPIFFGQPLEDGLDFQTKSFASNVADFQDVASAMWNSYIASKRRLVSDRVLYDPSRIDKKDINSSAPAAKIPVRPSAYGKNVAEAVYTFPFRDEQTASLLEGSSAVVNMANLVNGQNPAAQGQFTPGNRTKHEYSDIMGHGNEVNQMMAIMTENQVFTPMKEAIKLNILQYQPEGVLYNRDKNMEVQIKPQDLRTTAVHFKVSDGVNPTDKLMAGDEWQTALQAIASSPQIGAGYNIAPMFSYIMKLGGADLTPFEKSPLQLQYEQQMASWQQVAETAIKAGQPVPTQPTPSPELQQELQQKQQNGGVNPSAASSALDSTQGTPPTAIPANQGRTNGAGVTAQVGGR